MRPLFRKIGRPVRTGFCILLGNALLAFMVAAFVIPHNIIMGGTTGIGILLDNFLQIETAWIILILNVILLILGLIFLGKNFFLKTVASSILYPVFLAGMQRIPGIETLTDEPLIAVLFAGGLLGIAGGLVFRVGASTGGTDVINLCLSKWFHLPLAVFVYIVDFTIIGAQAIFSTPSVVLLGIIFLIIETLVLDRVMIFGKSQIQIFVVSDRYEEIRTALLSELEAGVTMTMIKTGHLEKEQQAVLCVIPPRKLYGANELIRGIDPTAFVTITQIKEVHGRGFTFDRRHK